MTNQNTIEENLASVTKQIDDALAKAGRPSGAVRLVAVTKKHSASYIERAVASGCVDVGENYVQELKAKQQELPDPDINWHFIGRLQRNKVKDVIGCALIHGVDSARLAEEIDKRASAQGHKQNVLVAVHLGGEASKSGVEIKDLPEVLEKIAELPSVECDGLMTLPPPGDSRGHFAQLRKVRDELRKSGHSLPELSMGMSNDFAVAIEEGATIVRVGSAIFGPRPTE